MSVTDTEARRQAWGLWRVWGGRYLLDNGSGGPNPGGAQCVNVPGTYWAWFGVETIAGNALDWIGFHDRSREWVPSHRWTPLRAGDCAVFKPDRVGRFGHVDIVLDGSVGPWRGVDQNWPLGSPVAQVWHARSDIEGVIRLRR